MSFIKDALHDSQTLLNTFLNEDKTLQSIQSSIDLMVGSLKLEGRILACGNGGSFCDSMHFVEELTGRFRKDRPPISAISMGDPGHITCVGNDYGFEYIFSRHVEAHGRKGDSLLAISTSGNSKNVIEAVKTAKSKGLKTILLSGKDGGELKNICDISIVVPHQVTDRIQEIHIKVIHIFIEGIERQLYPHHYS